MIQLPQNFDQKKIILAVLMTIAVLYVDLTFLIGPLTKSLGASRAKIIKLKSDIDKFNKDLIIMQSQKQKKPAKAEAQTIITQDQISFFLRQVQDLANKNGLIITQFKQSVAPGEGAAAKAPFDTIRFMLDLSCDYHALGAFINQVEHLDIFVNIEDIKITPSVSDIFHQSANLVMSLYVKK